VEKLEFFKVNQEKISNLKLTAVKIEVRSRAAPRRNEIFLFNDSIRS
jgi:hypothetical protein